MILLISPYQNAPEFAAQIKIATQDEVKTVNSFRLALTALRSQTFDLVIADENLVESTPGCLDSLLQRMETAAPFVIDMACLRPERVCKLVLSAKRRRELDFEMACRRAMAELRSEMKSEITGLLIQSELVLSMPNLPPPVDEKLSAVLEIAKRLRLHLETDRQ